MSNTAFRNNTMTRELHVACAVVAAVALLAIAGCGVKPGADAAAGASADTAAGGRPSTGGSGYVGTGIPAPTAGGISGVSGVSAAAAAAAGAGAAAAAVPCPTTLLAQRCQVCHGNPPLAGAPMPLMTSQDFQAPAKSNPSMTVYQLARQRVNAATKPMPPSGSLSSTELATINAWLDSGARGCVSSAPGSAGSPGAAGSLAANGFSGAGGSTGSAGSSGYDPGFPVNKTVPDLCFDLLAHDSQMPNDSSKFSVKAGEFYHNFVFKAPYNLPMWGLNVTGILDNAAVVHHFLLFQVVSGSNWVDGSHADGIGTHPNSELMAVWTPGAQPYVMPADVGEQFPKPGGYFELEFHYFNSTGAAVVDRSGMHICVTSKEQKNTATVTFLGTENITLPANAMGTATGTCKPSYQTGDIHVVYANPHMHKLGTHLTTVINRAAGGTDVLVDQPFQFLDQRNYPTPAIVHPGDTLTTTCTYLNTTASAVRFGSSTTKEMCYNFAVSYPANAMANPGGSLEGALNTCLHQ
jgi:hypothetical protein